MNNNVRDLIDWWIIREKTLSKRNHDEFVRFFIYYMCLDAWITAESGEDNDSKKIKWLVDSNNLLKKKFYEAKRDELRALVGSKIEDMRPRYRGKYVELKDPDNFYLLL